MTIFYFLSKCLSSENSSGCRWWHRLVCSGGGGDAERDSSYYRYEPIRYYTDWVPLNTPPPSDTHTYACVGHGERCCSEQHANLMKNLQVIIGMLNSLTDLAHGYTIMRPVIPPRPRDVYHEWLLKWLDHGEP